MKRRRPEGRRPPTGHPLPERRERCAGTSTLVLLLQLVLLAISCGACADDEIDPARVTSSDTPSPKLFEASDGRYLMGTVLDITLLGPDEAALRRDLEWAFERVAALEAVASRHRADSALTRFNAAAGQPPSPAESPDLLALLTHSVDAGRTTGGAFDVTVGPLIRLWIAAAESDRWPGEAEIARARSVVGWEAIVLEPDGDIGLSSAGRAVDFGGIAKGYALDVVRDGLLRRGVTRGLLDFGGSSVWAMGHAPDGGPWLFEVDAREPDGPRRVLALENAALSVSSSLGETQVIGGRVVGHVIDPRSGLTIDAPRTAVAIGDSATRAEAWSTALLVLDAEEGQVRAGEAAAIEAWVLFESGHATSTPGFDRSWARRPITPEGPASRCSPPPSGCP